jgi:hypothetical protein
MLRVDKPDSVRALARPDPLGGQLLPRQPAIDCVQDEWSRRLALCGGRARIQNPALVVIDE